MVTQALLKKYVDGQKKLLHEQGLIHYRNQVLIRMFDDASESLDRRKIFKKAGSAWIRLKKDGSIDVESATTPVFIDDETAKTYHQMLKMPLKHVDHTDLYNTEFEAIQMQKPVIVIPDKIDTNGAVIPYSTTPLEGFIIETLARFASNGQATDTEIIDFLTDPYPNGGGWYKRTPEFINHVKHLLETLMYKGKLDVDEKTEKYQLTHRNSASKVK